MAPPQHTTMAPCNGIQQWHHVRSPKVGRHPPPQPWYATMAPYDGTQQWHHVHCTLQWHPGATSNPPKWFVALPPIGSKNPYSYRYLGKKDISAPRKTQNFLERQYPSTSTICPPLILVGGMTSISKQRQDATGRQVAGRFRDLFLGGFA